MDHLPLLSIPVLYVLFAFLKPTIQPHLPFNLCAMCAAVSLTWLGLLIAWLIGVTLSPITLAILMGMSVTGLMYKLENLYKKTKLRHFWWVRLIIILGGFYSIQLTLGEKWSELILILIISLFAIVIPTFLMQGTTRDPNSLMKKLDDCC